MNIRNGRIATTRPRAIVAIVAAALSMAGATVALAQSTVPEFPITAVGPEYNPDLPTIVVIDAGGTITAGAVTRISYLNYGGEGPENGVQTILEDMFPELAEIANLRVVDMAGNGYSLGLSSRVSTETLYAASRTIDMYLAMDDVDGVVITAGTNVLEEDAYFLDLTVQSPKPVVLTGSMHQYGTFTFDGYTNLFSSIRLAASGMTTCFGTVVLLGDQFFPAREATKTDGYRMDTFDARLYGPLGVVNQDYVRVMRAPARAFACGMDEWATPFDLSEISWEDLPIVEVITSHIESTGGPLQGAVAGGAAGIVFTGHGPGGLSYLQTEARDAALEAGVVLVSTTRTGGEGNYDSGGTTINAADLLPWKARVLLQLSLAFSDDVEQIRTWFTTIGYAQIDMSGALN